MQDFIAILGLLIASATKFFLAPSIAVYMGYSMLQSILITSIGGTIGFLIFFKFGIIIHRWYLTLFRKKNKPKFNRRNRTIVKVKRKYGLLGLSILTPCLLSIPIGSLLASRYYSKDKRAFPAFILSIVLWSIVLTSLSIYVFDESL